MIDPTVQEAFNNMIVASISACRLTTPQAAVLLADTIGQLSRYSEDPETALAMLIDRTKEAARAAAMLEQPDKEDGA